MPGIVGGVLRLMRKKRMMHAVKKLCPRRPPRMKGICLRNKQQSQVS